jgi:DNA-binding HxlR family transcriptional regulator
MIAKFIASIIKNMSEEILNDLLKALMLEIAINRKNSGFIQVSKEYQKTVNEIVIKNLSDEEANEKLSRVGRDMLERVRANRNA